jgi:hypothetical protein
MAYTRGGQRKTVWFYLYPPLTRGGYGGLLLRAAQFSTRRSTTRRLTIPCAVVEAITHCERLRTSRQ